MPRSSIPRLPQLLDRKIYKTGQTRGADDDVIYQNRVSRTSTVLIPYTCWPQCRTPSATEPAYANGYIVLVSPTDYFQNPRIAPELAAQGLQIGVNALVFYETRAQWAANNPEAMNWTAASSRTNPLGGQYVARIAATTAAANGARINRGFTATAMKGAGIRVFEYACADAIEKCRLQLELLFWCCQDSAEVAVANGMSRADAGTRKDWNFQQCSDQGLADIERLTAARLLNANGRTVCPLCLEEFSSQGFFSRMEQAEGRAVHDLTVTELNLFHIEEVRIGTLNHRPYNLGWGHHHCNVVVKDSGIVNTLHWMRDVLDRNGAPKRTHEVAPSSRTRPHATVKRPVNLT
jgi:hypothetical protein